VSVALVAPPPFRARAPVAVFASVRPRAARCGPDGQAVTACSVAPPVSAAGSIHTTSRTLRIAANTRGSALAPLHAGQVDVVVGWGRMPDGPPVRSLTVDAEEILAVVRDDHPGARTSFDPDAHPRLGTRSFHPPLLHDIVLMWTAESESPAIHDLGASFSW
jgi:hypothetical protein